MSVNVVKRKTNPKNNKPKTERNETRNKNSKMIERVKNSCLGKLVRRVMGEETGAVMMEYVIVAVFIGACVVVAAWLFGAQILGMFGVAGDAATGRTDTAKENISAIQQAKPAQNQAALEAAKAFPVAEEEGQVNAGN